MVVVAMPVCHLGVRMVVVAVFRTTRAIVDAR
jgi:hypothetical protein